MTKVPIKPLPQQHKAWQAFKDDVIDDILYGGGAGGGKSYWLCQVATVVCHELPGSSFGLGRKELTNLKKTTYITMMEVFRDMEIPNSSWKLNGQDNYIEFNNGSRIYLIDMAYKPTDPEYDRFGGFLLTHAGVEELPECNKKGVEVLKTRIGRNNRFNINGKDIEVKGKFLATCNPNNNWVKAMYIDPIKRGTMPENRIFIPALATDNKYLPLDYINKLRNTENKQLRERLLHGNWDYADESSQIFNPDAIYNMPFAIVDKPGTRYIVFDPSGRGKDQNMFVVFDGWEAIYARKKEQMGLEEKIQALRILQERYQVPNNRVIIDAVGVGEDISNSVALQGCIPFKSNYKPFKTSKSITEVDHAGIIREDKMVSVFKNLRAQCVFTLAKKVNTNEVKISFDNQELKDDLFQELVLLNEVMAGTMKDVTSKDEIKESIGRSPDISDCFIMRAYFDVRGIIEPDFSEFSQVRDVQERSFNKYKNANKSTR